MSDGDGLRFAVDCYALECMPRSLAVAAATSLKSKKMKGIFGNPRTKRLLGHVLFGLDRVLARFASKPKRRRIRAGSLGPMASVFGRHFRFVFEVGSGHGVDLGAESGLGLISNPGLDLGSEPRSGHFSNQGSEPISILGKFPLSLLGLDLGSGHSLAPASFNAQVLPILPSTAFASLPSKLVPFLPEKDAGGS